MALRSFHSFVPVMLLLTLLMALTGCTPQLALPNVKSAAPATTLRVWLWPGSGLETSIKAYVLSHHNIDVEVTIAQFDDMVPSLKTSFATRSDAPDIVLLDVSQLNQLKRFPMYFYNMYDFGDERIHYLEWKWRQAESKDGTFLYGMPADIGPVALAYRHDLFQAAGLPYERSEVSSAFGSWDDFERAGLLLKEKTGVFLFDNLSNVYSTYMNQFEDSPFSAQVSGHIAMNTRMKEAWDRAVRFHKLGLNAGLPSQTPAWAEGAVSGQFAAVLAPSWVHGAMKKNAPATSGKWDLARAPGQSSNWQGSFLSVPKSSRYPKEAYELALWLTAPQQQLSNFMANGNFPSTPESYASASFLDVRDPFFHNAPVGQLYSYSALRYKAEYEEMDFSRIDRIVRDGLRRVEGEGMDPVRAWTSVLQQIHEQAKGE
ncbi:MULTISPECIES: ABC transporter substrate-binding protein [unclassified Paenibacillus]|uniref:ABC transporter substrate-binding protein n=1 Tax=unclassified Paenibacillus TaxID=185978 RepID=UPI00362D2662